MDSLRRVYGSQRQRGAARRRPLTWRRRPPRIGKAEARLAAALEQLQEGVPLNWTQLEDDPELVTLAHLYTVAAEARGSALTPLPPDLEAATTARMLARLPKPKPQVQKVAPKTLAGFSENVQVPTQVEDDIPALRTRAPQIAVAALAAGLLVALIAWLASIVLAPPRGDLQWIEVRQGGKIIQAANVPSSYKPPVCPAAVLTDTTPFELRRYIGSDRQKAQGDVDFPIEYLPDVVTSSIPYTLTLVDTSVGTCGEVGSIPAASVKLSYLARYNGPTGAVKLSPISVFEQKRQTLLIDVTGGAWRQVAVGARKGALWRGPSYKDKSGIFWPDEVEVLMMEHGDISDVYIGQVNLGVTDALMLAIVAALPNTAQPTPGQATMQNATPTPPAARLYMPFDPGSTSVQRR